MTVLQQYYTSFINSENGRAGFQVNAMSPTMSPETQDLLSRLIVYRIPSGLDERAIETHPVALRYYYHNSQECILLCSQSCGSDENGRPGNFFAHSLVLSPRSLTYQPPILYWHSPFWHKKAESSNQLVPLTEQSMSPSATLLEDMWTFLASEARQDAFHRLMCALVHSKSSNRRIIILDSAEHVALWLAAVSCMLPPSYRPLVSFSTYNHDPYQSWFLITGTNDPNTLHGSIEDSASHFILDGRTLQSSPVEPSSYASLVRSLCNQKSYRKTLLQYFAECEKRFPPPSTLDENLEMLATYIHLHTQQEPIALKTPWLPTIKTVLDGFEQLPDYDEEDLQELEQWINLLSYAREQSRNPEIQALYARVSKIANKHNVFTDQRMEKDLSLSTRYLLQEDYMEKAAEELRALCDVSGEATFTTFINRPSYLNSLSGIVQGASPRSLQYIWTSLGPYFRPASQTASIFVYTLTLWGRLLDQKSPNAEPLLQALKRAIAKQELIWFPLLLSQKSLPQSQVLFDFYCQYAQPLPIQSRETYRALFAKVLPDLLKNEFSNDLNASRQKLTLLRQWLAYTNQSEQPDPLFFVNEGLQIIRKQERDSQWQTLLPELLTADDLRPHLGPWEPRLVQEFFANISLQHFLNEHVELYQRYQHSPQLSDLQQQVLAGLIAMANGRLEPDQTQSVYLYLQTLSPDAYRMEVGGFLVVFLQRLTDEEQHRQMLSATFLAKYSLFFFLSYWELITALLTSLSTNALEKIVRLFSYWFALSPEQFTQPEQKYLVQQFFLLLPQQLHAMQKLKEAPSAFENISSKASSAPWYPVIEELLVIRKKNLTEKSQDWMRSVQQRLPYQKNTGNEPEQKLSKEIDELLQKGTVCERHLERLMPLYLQNELFWTIYKERLLLILRGQNTEQILEIFAFWFERSFSAFAQKPYLAQGFFTRIAPICELAWKEHHGQMQKMLPQVNDLAARHSKKYPWYPLLRPVLAGEGMN